MDRDVGMPMGEIKKPINLSTDTMHGMGAGMDAVREQKLGASTAITVIIIEIGLGGSTRGCTAFTDIEGINWLAEVKTATNDIN